MHFETAQPARGEAFFNRKRELDELLQTASDLSNGVVRYYSLMGTRKIGKSSLLYEFRRRVPSDVLTVYLDCWDVCADSVDFFSRYLKRSIDAALVYKEWASKTGLLEQTLPGGPESAITASKIRALGISSLDRGLDLLAYLENGRLSRSIAGYVVDLPAQMAAELGVFYVVILDEFQEIARLNKLKPFRGGGDIFPLLRARWQHQKRVTYFIAGSKITLLRQLIFEEYAPFFQHFNLLDIAPFTPEDAREMLSVLSEKSGRPIPDDLIERILHIVGTNPFYLQVMGEELCKPHQEISEDGLKVVLQETLFDATGRLNLYFQQLYQGVVGKSASMERVLLNLTEEKTVTELGKVLRVAPGTANSWLERCLREDVVSKRGMKYFIPDPCFRKWLASKTDLGRILPPLVVGDETEKRVAHTLGKQGFRLVYQSRASRGAFDLLAILNSTEIGIQCKRTRLPYYLKGEEYALMRHWADRMGWIPVLALDVDEQIRFYSLDNLAPTDGSVRIDETTPALGSLLALL